MNWEWIKDFLKPELIWFLVGLLLLILEFALPGLIIFFFGVVELVVIEAITPKAGGKVEFHGTNWKIRADGDIAAGAVVDIIGKDNITLKVKAI